MDDADLVVGQGQMSVAAGQGVLMTGVLDGQNKG